MASLIADIAALNELTIGPVLAGGDPAAAEELAGFNIRTVHRPALVVGATCAEDISIAVRFADEHGLPVAVQATGHGQFLPALGAVHVTTKRMRSVSVDPDRQTARIGAGVRWREVIDRAIVHGLAPLSGSSSRVGAVGYSLGGGLGLMARRYGFAADHVVRLTMVRADGRVITVDAENEPDLFWAVRGGKSNFGIVTTLEFGLVPVTDVYGSSIYFAAESTADVLHAYREWAPSLPNAATTSIAMLRLPRIEALPPKLRGRSVTHLRFILDGPDSDGERLLSPMVDAGVKVMGVTGRMSVAALDAIHQDPVDPLPIWERTGQLTELTVDAVERMVAIAGPESDVPFFVVELRQLGGALTNEPSVPNAVAGRAAAYSMQLLGVPGPGDAELLQSGADELFDALNPWSPGTSLMNWMGEHNTPELVAQAWAPEVHARLMSIKNEVDPSNVFRFGHPLA